MMQKNNLAILFLVFSIVILSLVLSSCSQESLESYKTNLNSDKVLLNKSCLMIIAPKNFRDEELFVTKETLENVGVNVTVTSVVTGNIRGMLGASVLVNKSISDLNPDDFDCVIVVGGSGAPELLNYKEVVDFVKLSYDSGKLVGAICLGPMVLAETGILRRKKATVFKASESLELFKEKNVIFVDKPVVRSERIVTANGPKAAKEFAQVIVEELAVKS